MQQYAFGREIWRRFRRNRSGMFGLAIISIALLAAVFGYCFVPDNTPDADLQTVEIEAKKPGYTQTFLLLPRLEVTQTSWYQDFLYGKPSSFDFVPINSYTVKND